MNIWAVSCGMLANEYLATGKQLNLHSKFKHGCNLSIAPHLVYIGDVTKGEVPFGIQLKSDDWLLVANQLAINPDITCRHHNRLIIGEINIELPVKPNIQSQLDVFSEDEQSQIKRNALNISKQLSKYIKMNGLDFNQELTGEIKWPKSETELRLFFKYYLGRGQGLTPAGDDFIIGILAIEAVMPFLFPRFNEILVELLRLEVTTSVSENYLKAACQGHFSPVVCHLMESLKKADVVSLSFYVEKLAQSGSTSGSDTIVGLIVAILANIEECN